MNRPSEVSYAKPIGMVLLTVFVSAIGVVFVAVLGFVLSSSLKWNSEFINPLLVPALIAIIGFFFVPYIPSFFKYECPRCRTRNLLVDSCRSLSFHCTACGAEKNTWFHVG